MITEKQVYEWVKTGHWTFAQFEEWAYDERQKASDDAYKSGYDSASSDSYEWGFQSRDQ